MRTSYLCAASLSILLWFTSRFRACFALNLCICFSRPAISLETSFS
jgi:hypothetical protein